MGSMTFINLHNGKHEPDVEEYLDKLKAADYLVLAGFIFIQKPKRGKQYEVVAIDQESYINGCGKEGSIRAFAPTLLKAVKQVHDDVFQPFTEDQPPQRP